MRIFIKNVNWNFHEKQLPIGVSDYKEIIDKNFYYIDKTLFIDDILKYSSKVALITRPRRFGKTLNLSMLKYFFEKTELSNAYLFEDKKIWQLPEHAALQGKFPVIFLTFKDVKQNNWQDTKDRLIAIIAAEYERHRYLLNTDHLSSAEKEIYRQIIDQKTSNTHYYNSLKNLSEFLYRFYKVKPLVLLDEYDSPIHAGFMHGYYDEVIEFMRSLMVSVFKDNTYLEGGIITGILRASKEGMFSGLNNLELFTMLDDFMSDKFGFTQPEIDQLLQDYSLGKIFEEFKSWYNGYLIGKTKIYNPWSVLNCIKFNGEFLPYWANTSDNALIGTIITQSEIDVKDACYDLIAGKIVKDIEIDSQMTFSELIEEPNSIWSLLLFSGYVTGHSYRYEKNAIYADLMLPNEELRGLFEKLVNKAFRKNLNNKEIIELNKALGEANGVSFSKLFSKFIMQSMSYYDISADEPEKSYHLFALGLLVILGDRYIVQSNFPHLRSASMGTPYRESGESLPEVAKPYSVVFLSQAETGRFDIMLIPKDKTAIGLVIEFKKMDDYETMQKCADRALEQIKEKNYVAQLQQHDIQKIVGFGIAIHKKEVLLKQEEL